MLYLLKQIIHLCQFYKEDKQIEVDLQNDARDARGNHNSWWEYVIFAFNIGDGGSPGVSPTISYKESLARVFINLNLFWNNPYSCCDHPILHALFDCTLNFFDFTLNLLFCILNLFAYLFSNYGWILPVFCLLQPVLRKYIVLRYHKSIFKLRYCTPSHNCLALLNFYHNNHHKGIIVLRDFINNKSLRIATGIPKLDWSDYINYNIPSYYSLQKICDSLGLVCVNRLNLGLETIHHTYKGAGLNSIINGIFKFSSIVVQITTTAYSHVHKRKVFRIFNILLIAGIGVVVWYKCVKYFNPPFIIPEPPSTFQNPTAVVAGYKKVTFWLTEDPYKIVKRAYLYEPPFKDIIKITQFWGWSGEGMIDRDRLTYTGLAIMISTFITTGILQTTVPMLTEYPWS